MLLGYPGDAAEMKRQMLNAWIRGSGTYDIVLDFDAVLRDPGDETIMQAGLKHGNSREEFSEVPQSWPASGRKFESSVNAEDVRRECL